MLIALLLSGLLGLSLALAEPCRDDDRPETFISGVVRDDNGPVAGAVVRVQATDITTRTLTDGSFTLRRPGDEGTYSLTAWAPGYYIAGGHPLSAVAQAVVLTLVRHSTRDNPDYQWISAFASEGKSDNCQNCHSAPGNQNSPLPFDEWQQDAHGRSGKNVRFMTMYRGTNISGQQSPPTRYGYSRDYGRAPVRPDPSKPYFGPGYLLDFPGTRGNCAACHNPAASVNSPYGTDPTSPSGVASEGVTCDFCHKVWDVRLDPATGRPYLNNPGVLSFELRRPEGTHQFFAGPFDDVAPGEDTYAPLMKRSQFCAPCHFGAFWDTTIYNSFGEWLESPYSDARTGRTCQDCHMPQGRTDHYARLDKGGKKRDRSSIFGHLMPGASDEGLLRNAVTMTVSGAMKGQRVSVDVHIRNDKTGHHVPTDSPLRHMILLVEASDTRGRPLALLEGPTVPAWGGLGDPAKGYYAGMPGKAYAKVLAEVWTGVSPTGSYWNHTRVVSDNRIAAFAEDSTTFTFEAPTDGPSSITARLIFRRAFKSLVDQKGWADPDSVMAQESISIR